MYHPMLSFAVAQAHIDDLIRESRHTSSHRHPVPPESPAFESGSFDPNERRASLTRRLARFAARRTRPSAA